ncbi:hypothetical protein Tco_0733924 [Tanacetum coccineum]
MVTAVGDIKNSEGGENSEREGKECRVRLGGRGGWGDVGGWGGGGWGGGAVGSEAVCIGGMRLHSVPSGGVCGASEYIAICSSAVARPMSITHSSSASTVPDMKRKVAMPGSDWVLVLTYFVAVMDVWFRADIGSHLYS